MTYSMKGYAAATYDAFQQTSDPNANREKIKAEYAKAIANESSAMVFSLPMTLAGGALGTGAANAVFGRNKGAIDLAQGKIRPSEVKDNLLAIKDAVSPPPVRLVVADMDNTIAPSYRAIRVGEILAWTHSERAPLRTPSELLRSVQRTGTALPRPDSMFAVSEEMIESHAEHLIRVQAILQLFF